MWTVHYYMIDIVRYMGVISSDKSSVVLQCSFILDIDGNTHSNVSINWFHYIRTILSFFSNNMYLLILYTRSVLNMDEFVSAPQAFNVAFQNIPNPHHNRHSTGV